MTRTLALVAGLLILAACWLGPLPAAMRGSFAVHMAMHMAVVAVASGLLAIAVAGSRRDPARHFPALFSPIPASLVELVIVWAWHTPALHHAARSSTAGLCAEQGSFLLCGLYLWLAVFGGDPEKRRDRAIAGILGLLLTAMHMTLLGALLGLSPRPLYEDHGSASAPGHGLGHGHAPPTTRLTGLTPLEDQHLGGAIMLLVGGVVYLGGALWSTVLLLHQPSVRKEGLS